METYFENKQRLEREKEELQNEIEFVIPFQNISDSQKEQGIFLIISKTLRSFSV